MKQKRGGTERYKEKPSLCIGAQTGALKRGRRKRTGWGKHVYDEKAGQGGEATT